MKLYKVIPAMALILALCACGGNTGNNSPSEPETAPVEEETTQTTTLTGTYTAYVTGYDWGAAVDKVVISFDAVLDAVSKEDFMVTETKSATDYTAEGTPVVEQTFDREIVDAYPVDEDGERTSAAANQIALELYASPSDGSPINYDPATGTNTWCDPYYLTIEMADGAALTSDEQEVTGIEIVTTPDEVVTVVDSVPVDSFTATDGITYRYAHYEPEGGSKTTFVWLHGGGEGGTEDTAPKTDPRIVMLANEAGNFTMEEFQTKTGGVNVLIPQCPTMWLDMTGEGRTENILYVNDGTSFYTESLKELLDFYQEETGAEKLILCGCSNGGFMSLLMAILYPDEVTGIVPICEGLRDEIITDAQLEGIKDMPMFFIYSEDDTTIPPVDFEIPTLARLKEMGASRLHVSTTEHVVDTSGLYKGADGNPYQYAGHWSWIYFDNDEAECNEHEGETGWDFVAEIVAE